MYLHLATSLGSHGYKLVDKYTTTGAETWVMIFWKKKKKKNKQKKQGS